VSRKLLAFLLSELRTVRVICPECKAVTEIPADQLPVRFADPHCPVCRRPWHGLAGRDGSRLAALGRAIHDIQQSASGDMVEFVIPDDGE
jgi:hypothetical protein